MHFSRFGGFNRKLYELQMSVVEAGGIPLLVRVLESRRGLTRARGQCALGRRLRSARTRTVQCGYYACICRGRCHSGSRRAAVVAVGRREGVCCCALRILGLNADNRAAIATAGGRVLFRL